MTKIDEIVECLGEPYYRSKNAVIYNADSLELMSKIKTKIFDLTITSPPYNIGKEYESIMPVEDYVSWTAKWVNHVYDITEDNGALMLNVGYLEYPGIANALPIPYLIWDKIHFYLMQEIIWNYGAGVSCKKYLSPRNEKILWYVKNESDYTFNLDDIRDPDVKYPNQKKNGKLRCNTLGKNPSDVWQIAKVTSGTNRASKERTSHPAQFPVDLVQRMVLGFSNPGDLILDPFLGSGTVAEVALNNNRQVVGIEINESYCQIAVNRIQSLSRQSHITSSIYTSQQPAEDEIVDHFELSDQSNRHDLSSQI